MITCSELYVLKMVLGIDIWRERANLYRSYLGLQVNHY
jgi:hypothetical protein